MTNIFDNAESVTIDNVEIKSLKTSDNGVLFEKIIGYALALSSNHDTINQGDTATLTATLTNGGVAVEGEIVTFDNGSGTTIITEYQQSYVLPDNYKFTLPDIVRDHHLEYISTGSAENWLVFEEYDDQHRIVEMTQSTPIPEIIPMSSSTVYVCGNTLYYYDENGELATKDVTDYDMNNITAMEGNVGVIIETEIYTDVTDSNGEATYGYVGQSTGEVTITAKSIDIQATHNITVEPVV